MVAETIEGSLPSTERLSSTESIQVGRNDVTNDFSHDLRSQQPWLAANFHVSLLEGFAERLVN